MNMGLTQRCGTYVGMDQTDEPGVDDVEKRIKSLMPV
jgi:hypothetical protein